MQTPALHISVEGIDGSGKTTLVKRLAEHFTSKGKTVQVFCFPDRSTEVGKLIDKVLRKEISMNPITLQFLFSANRSELQEKIKSATGIILYDRYLDSAVAYASAQGIDGQWIRTLDRACLRPKINLFLEIAPTVALQRLHLRETKGGELYDKLPFQEKVHKGYMECYSPTGAYKSEEKDFPRFFCSLDAGQEQESVFKEALTFIEVFL